MVMPYHQVNVLTGVKGCTVIEDAAKYAEIIKKAKRPLLVLGPLLTGNPFGDKILLEYALAIAAAGNIPTVATANIRGKMLEMGATPDSEYDVIEIINSLKKPDWPGVRNEGNHDLVMFFGIRSDLGNQGLSTLKHFAPHLKTMTMCKYVFPHANYSLPNIRKDEKWKSFLEELITKLKEEE